MGHVELQRKRARDRKSQQAMRDRNKWTIQTLTEQSVLLTRTIEQRDGQLAVLEDRIRYLEHENSLLKAQNNTLQVTPCPRAEGSQWIPNPWEVATRTAEPTCLADEILQGFVTSVRTDRFLASTDRERAASYSVKPDLRSLIEPGARTDDDISNVVAGVVRSYGEIETLPKQVAVFWNMSLLLKWMVLLDKQSWDSLPEWLRPTQLQRSTPHAAWIDRIPWPSVREYLIVHPSITLDDWASKYSYSFDINWKYDPSHVVISSGDCVTGSSLSINSVYEEHLRQLRNWTVGHVFRQRFPEIASIIDQDAK